MPTWETSKTKYNSNRYIKNTHNCYSYFLNKIDPKIAKDCKKIAKKSKKSSLKKICNRKEFRHSLLPQPGSYAGLPPPKTHTCKDKIKRVIADNKHITVVKEKEKCPPKYYKGALVVKPGVKRSYHFYSQDKDKRWSHKDGTKVANRVDASRRIIRNPRKSNRNFGKKKNYKNFCTYFCVPEDDKKKL